MARVTVEDCRQFVQNRFELVVVAAQRAKEISAGVPLTIERDNDKNPVIALREIAQETISTDILKETVIRSLRRITNEDIEEETSNESYLETESEIDQEIQDFSKNNFIQDENFSFEDDLDTED